MIKEIMKMKYREFTDKFTTFDDGNASSRIVDLILEVRNIHTK